MKHLSFDQMTTDQTSRQILKPTTSRCPRCHQTCPAEVWKSGESPARVFLTRTCPDHGDASVCISSDARFYWLAKGSDEKLTDSTTCGPGCACSADSAGNRGTLGRNAFAVDQTIEKLSTCLALIEIVDSCNLSCPSCFADSPVGTGANLSYRSLDDLKLRITGVLDRKGEIEILQLTGGEPTLHPEFFELLDWLHAEDRIDYVLINTNGVLVATDDAFLAQLSRRVSRGHLQLYLQFDGPQEEGQRELRGGDLRRMKRQAMDRCEKIGLPVTLAMTVTSCNLPHLWDTISWGLQFDHCRGITFQPEFFSGRSIGSNEIRLNTADVILASVEQSNGQLNYDDFTPLPCGDPNCATIGYLLKTKDGTHSISRYVNFSEVQGFLQDKMDYCLEDLAACGCDNTALGALLKEFELREKDTFRLFIKPFMDAGTWDEDRIDRCCTHVIRPDGQLDSFCRYYLGSPPEVVQGEVVKLELP